MISDQQLKIKIEILTLMWRGVNNIQWHPLANTSDLEDIFLTRWVSWSANLQRPYIEGPITLSVSMLCLDCWRSMRSHGHCLMTPYYTHPPPLTRVNVYTVCVANSWARYAKTNILILLSIVSLLISSNAMSLWSGNHNKNQKK